MKQIEGVSNDSHKNVGLVHKSTVRTSSITRKLIFFFFPKKYLFSQEKLRLASSILEYLKPAPTVTRASTVLVEFTTDDRQDTGYLGIYQDKYTNLDLYQERNMFWGLES